MLVYKVDVLKELKENGYTTYSLFKNKQLSSKTVNDLKNGKMVGIITLNTICGLLKCQPGHLIKWVDDSEVNGETDVENGSEDKEE